ncbi:MAG: hypothetical protein IJD81_05485 [Oscillospiraceae bacterium]|nr:hypothetical protein [Oscillospiraceae bacterium]
MKNGWKLFAAGAVIGAVAGLVAYRKYQDSYEEVIEEEGKDAAAEEDDFVPVEEIDDGFDYVIEEEA